MTRGRAFENRRQEARHYLPSVPVTWTRAGAGRWRRGWLNDVSSSGAALLVPMDIAPKAGQEIEVRLRRDRRPISYRVVRVEPRQGLLGCRIASVSNRRAEPRDCYTRVPVSWRNGGRGRWRTGRLINASDSGLALLVHAMPPRAGDRIELARKGSGQRARCHVVRTEVCEGGRVTVACRLASLEGSRAWLCPPPRPQRSLRCLPGKISGKRAA